MTTSSRRGILPLNSSSEAEIRKICLQLLARREHSRRELQQKLRGRGFAGDGMRRVIDELAENGWQSDRRFAESYARQRMEKGYGPLRIGNELRQRGIEDFDLDGVMEQLAESWDELLDRLYARKFPGQKAMKRREWARRSRFLLQRGFSGEAVKALLQRLAITLEP